MGIAFAHLGRTLAEHGDCCILKSGNEHPRARAVMSTNELRNIASVRPFQPVRIHVSSGASFEVVHPDMMMVGIRTTAIGIPAPSDPGLWDRLIQVDNLHITHVEPLVRQSAEPPPNRN